MHIMQLVFNFGKMFHFGYNNFAGRNRVSCKFKVDCILIILFI